MLKVIYSEYKKIARSPEVITCNLCQSYAIKANKNFVARLNLAITKLLYW